MWYIRFTMVGAILLVAGAIPMVTSQVRSGMPVDGGAPWKVHLAKAEEALARGDLGEAELASRLAYGEAVWSRRWGAMIAAGDAALAIGKAGGRPEAFKAQARRAYRAALFRARAEGSVDGLLRAAEAFAALGDREVVAGCMRIAEGLAARETDPEVRARVGAFREWVARRWPDPASSGPGLF